MILHWFGKKQACASVPLTLAKAPLIDEKGCKKGAGTHTFAPSLVSLKFVQLF